MNTTPMRLFGRKKIKTSATEITRANVIYEVVTQGYIEHLKNRNAIKYLYNYYKGDQPILYRQKNIRDDIKNCIVENRANEIVNFKTGYLVGNPIQYISRNNSTNKSVSKMVDKLNDMMLSESKESKDKELVMWQNICGTAYRMCLPKQMDDEESPFSIYTLDPRNTYCIYSNTVGEPCIAGVYYTSDTVFGDDGDSTGVVNTYSVYTKDMYYEIVGDKITKAERHALGQIPIIEYPANMARLGAFEVVIPMLDAINTVASNRIDGIEQFIQSLVVLYNAELPEGEDATTLQQKGMVCLKSTGENKADIKLMSETLSQADTQTLKDDMYQSVLEIVGMPSQGNGNTGDSSNNGAVIMKNGWQGAEARAKDSELMFKESERKFLRLVLRLCRDLSDIKLNVSDIEAHFTRRNYEDISSKANVLSILLGTGKVAPKLCFEASGLFIDSEEAYQESMAYAEEQAQKAMELVRANAMNQPEEEEKVNDTEEETPSDR